MLYKDDDESFDGVMISNDDDIFEYINKYNFECICLHGSFINHY